MGIADWIDRIRKRRPQEMRLSPALSRKTTLVHDLTALPENDLRRLFLENTGGKITKWHHYLDIYDRWFSAFRGRTDLRLLEVGVHRGGSLRMWRDYFHPDAIIVGLDIHPRSKVHEAPDRNIFVEIGDQANPSDLDRVIETRGPFDIVIDDGGHTATQQATSFNRLYGDGLNDGGVYVVEDLHTSYWPEFQDAERSFIDFVKPLVDRLHEPFLDNHSELRFRQGHREQLQSMDVSAFCANTRSITFYDSMVIFEKRRKAMPVSEIR
jgi:hypothetical protein